MKADTAFSKGVFVIAMVCVLAIVMIFALMIYLGLPLFQEGLFSDLLTQPWRPYHNQYGILPMIVGSVSIALLALSIAFPMSLGCAALTAILGQGWFAWFLKKAIEVMTGIPTVIYGFVGVFVLVPFMRSLFDSGSGMCILSASLLLAVLISPTMILFFIQSFKQVPRQYRQAVDALGATSVQKLVYLVIPCSVKGVVTGLILGLGRAMGDTMIALMIAGNAVAMPESVFSSSRTLTSHIALVIAADFDSIEFKTIFACGLLLYVFTAALVISIRTITHDFGKES